MKAFLKTLLVLISLCVHQFASAQEECPAWEDGSLHAGCTSTGEREYSFNQQSIEQGVGYLTRHPVPLSVLVPRKAWYELDRDGLLVGHGIGRDQLIGPLVEAQTKLIEWFRKDLEQGLDVPNITRKRLVAINKIITGKENPLTGEGERKDTYFISQLVVEYLAEDVIDDISPVVDRLRVAAGFKRPKDWGFGVLSPPNDPGSIDNDSVFYAMHRSRIKTILRERAAFLEGLLRSAQGEKYKKLKHERGGFETNRDNTLYEMDAARYFYHMKLAYRDIDFSQKKISGLLLRENNPLYYLFDVPDQRGKKTDYYVGENAGKERFWENYLSSKSLKIKGKYGSLFMVIANNYQERVAMLDVALRTLTDNLKPLMSKEELFNVLAQSWRELVLIHPFKDGNGRTMRLLVNALFMAYGFSPLSCDPNCLPFSHTTKHFKQDIRAARVLTENPLPIDKYPQWLAVPKDQELLEKIRGL